LGLQEKKMIADVARELFRVALGSSQKEAVPFERGVVRK
jgi:hypothetical protein